MNRTAGVSVAVALGVEESQAQQLASVLSPIGVAALVYFVPNSS